MVRLRHIALVLLATLALVAAGCGGDGDGDVPAGAVAVVDGNEIPKTEFDKLIDQAERGYKQSKRPFPKTGTREYQNIKNNAVQFLVERLYFELGAEDMDVEISDKDVNTRLADLKKQFFKGNEKRYQAALRQAGKTEGDVRQDVRAQLVQEKIAEQLTKEVEVSSGDIGKYYREHKAQYGTPSSREIRHILVSVCGGSQTNQPKPKDCKPAGEAKQLAEQIRTRLGSGESFAKLARRYSDDPGSKASGGKLTVSKGSTVAAFDKTAFELETGVLSQPVKTEYGFHLIEALSAVKPAKTTPIAEVRGQIRSQLVAQKRSEALSKWVEETKKKYSEKTQYQVGFAPPSTATQTTASR